ncbi:hypothetical protein [Ramlibacter sp.]|uniref:hypothetical protein n=1 Tax=Ramlibacter sp. TaxID=1917967 RepID=UPI0025D7DEF4|nr:hypothetical protein [Ramlibacter sp.]
MLSAWASAQTTAAPIRLRGTIESIAADRLVMKERSGERVELALAPNLTVTEIFPVGMDTVTPNSFVGVGATPQADGTQRAIAVLVFPEAMRGTGEGHRPFDFLPQSTMTNATVAGQATAADGNRLTLAYPGGEKTVVVAPGTPIVSLRPGSRELLVPGAGVSVTAQVVGEKATATRISTGRNGFAPPY